MGHPISFNWYELAPEMGPTPVEPTFQLADRRSSGNESKNSCRTPLCFPTKGWGVRFLDSWSIERAASLGRLRIRFSSETSASVS